MREMLKSIGELCRFVVNDKYLNSKEYGTLHNTILLLYICNASRLFLWNQYLSLSTEAAGFFFAPTSASPLHLFTSNDNDK